MHLTPIDTNFFQAFLTTYRSFATGPEVIHLLVKRYLLEPPAGLTPEQLSVWQTKKQTPIRLRHVRCNAFYRETNTVQGN